MNRPSSSIKVYLGLLMLLVVLRVALYFVPVEFVLADQERMVSWPSILAIWALGLIGVILAPRAGFPGMWDKEIQNRGRFFIPVLIGLSFGLLSVVLDLVQPLGGEIQIEFPASLVVYPMGGVLEEIIFRLLLTTFLVWLISTVILRERWQQGIFWMVAVSVALLYAFLQIGTYSMIAEKVTLLVGMRFLVLIGAYFIVAACLYRRYGFLSAVAMRLADYLVWHIIWGLLIQG